MLWRASEPAQTWDPTIGAYREQRVPLALSKSSISGISSDGRPTTPTSQRSSNASHASTTSSITSFPSTFTSPSFSRGAGSYTSKASYYSRSTQQSAVLPQRIFQTLPSEIYDAMLCQLKLIHEGPTLGSCQTCCLRDLCALSLTSRAWDKAVVKKM